MKIGPDYFVSMAEHGGIIRGVGRSPLEKALLEIGPQLSEGLIERMSFYVSPAELLDPDFTSAITEALAKAGAPSLFMPEITEGAVVQNMHLAALAMTRVEALTIADVNPADLAWARPEGTVCNIADRRFDLYLIDWKRGKRGDTSPPRSAANGFQISRWRVDSWQELYKPHKPLARL